MAATLGNLAAIGILMGGGVLLYASAAPDNAQLGPSVQEQFVSSAIQSDHAGMERALAQGASVDGTTFNGLTALMIVAADGDLPTVSLLLEQGADANRETKRGQCALGAAAFGACDPATIRTLLKAGADPNGGSWLRPLVGAATVQNAEAMQILLAAGADPNLADETGATALQTAAAAGRDDLVRLLRAVGATH